MKRTYIPVMILCFAMLARTELRAAQAEVGIDAELKVVSAFVWRGSTLNDEPCFQPSVSAVIGDFSAKLKGSWDLTSVSNAWQSSRVDAELEYTYKKDKHLIRPGFTAYIFHDDPAGKAKDTYECFVNYTYDVQLLPSVTLYYDFSKIDGFFADASIAHSFKVIENKASLDLKLLIEGGDKNFKNVLFNHPYNENEQQADNTSLVDFTVMAALPIDVCKTGVLAPAIKYVQIVDSTTKDILDAAGDDTSIFVYSLAYSMSF